MAPTLDRFEQEMNVFGEDLVKIYDGLMGGNKRDNDWLCFDIVLQGDVNSWLLRRYNNGQNSVPPLGTYLRQKSPGWFLMRFNEDYEFVDSETKLELKPPEENRKEESKAEQGLITRFGTIINLSPTHKPRRKQDGTT